MNESAKGEWVARVPHWFHSIDLGDGVTPPDTKSPEQLHTELEAIRLPNLNDQTVLDIGAWDGFFSFQCEQRGAARVLALDRFVWSMDLAVWAERTRSRAAAGRRSPHSGEAPDGWAPVALPGNAGFDTAHRILGRRVEERAVDFLSVDPEEIGSFDVVLFLDVLHHMRDLERVAAFTRHLAILDTECNYFPGLEDRGLYQFFGGTELDQDPTNWWSPNAKALIGSCIAAGFRSAEIVAAYPPAAIPPNPSDSTPIRGRCVVHAFG